MSHRDYYHSSSRNVDGILSTARVYRLLTEPHDASEGRAAQGYARTIEYGDAVHVNKAPPSRAGAAKEHRRFAPYVERPGKVDASEMAERQHSANTDPSDDEDAAPADFFGLGVAATTATAASVSLRRKPSVHGAGIVLKSTAQDVLPAPPAAQLPPPSASVPATLPSLVPYGALLSADETTTTHHGSTGDLLAPSVVTTYARAIPQQQQDRTINTTPLSNAKGSIVPPERAQYEWDHERNRVVPRYSSVDGTMCWKCRKKGHLPEHCTASLTVSQPSSTSNDDQPHNVYRTKDGKETIYSDRLRYYHARCKGLGKGGGQCATCGNAHNLARCLACDEDYCDGRGHLTDHLAAHGNHTELYSHKLRRQIKCSNATCEEMDIYKLFTCSDCLMKVFARHYSMATAVWSATGLRTVGNIICCAEHFRWHEINCTNADSSAPTSRFVVHGNLDQMKGLLSEFYL